MPYLILARHGNTFESDQTPTWVGSETNLPLTAKGETQGQAIADMIVRDYAPVSAIVAGPLIRTKRFAEILEKAVNNTHVIDERLCEINYGLWENKSSDEIRKLYGDTIVDGWEKDGTWPKGMHWAPSKEKLLSNIQSLLEEQHKELTQRVQHNRVLFTSNGILRFVYTHLTGKPPSPEAKVKPGNYCILEPTEHGWDIIEWNKKPE